MSYDIYLKEKSTGEFSVSLSSRRLKNPNIYPYNVFKNKDIEPFVFAPITVLYGNNGSGKSTILNIIANKLMLKGKEYSTSNTFGTVDYCGQFSNECTYRGETPEEALSNSREFVQKYLDDTEGK
ncbi:ATP-binding cassette domain-containing protein [Butyrivibrio sp. AE3006]|uniref:ATP-binding cassette domain-containing protein n=1 Tax=Butyrivibrio sp. AE3006 TaxID=1280673 RepID=UPI00041DD235|nr:ABC transporter ATP-binding protein [Butyrivibrio sp. AE3006]